MDNEENRESSAPSFVEFDNGIPYGVTGEDWPSPDPSANDGVPPYTPYTPPEPPVSPAPKKKTTLIVALAGLLVVAALIACVLFLGGGPLAGKGKLPVRVALPGMAAEDGSAYLPLSGGDCPEIDGEVFNAAVSEDRKHVVVQLEDGELYVTDKALSEKHRIADNAAKFFAIRNDGFFYKDQDDIWYRISFADYSSEELGDVGLVVAENNTSVAYADDYGDVYTMAAGTTEKVKVGVWESSIEMEAISDDGQMAVWVNEEDGEQKIMLSGGDECSTLGSINSKYNYTYVRFTADQQLAVITNLYCDCVWIKRPGVEPIKAKLGAELASSAVFSQSGFIGYYNAKEVSSIYVAAEGDKYKNIYRISEDGDRERVVSEVQDFYVANDNIVYIDKDGALYCAKLKDSDTSDEFRIASDVDAFTVTRNGKYVYYMRDYDETDESGTLYCLKLGDEEPVKVSADVSNLWYDYLDLSFSEDGKTVFYYKDVEKIGDSYARQGTLMKWTVGDKSGAKIASEALTTYLRSGLYAGELDTKDIYYLKYVSKGDAGDVIADLMHYDGSKSEKKATDIVY